MTKCKIEQVKFKTSKGREITLSFDEAKDLFDAMKNIFGQQDVQQIFIYEDQFYPWRHPAIKYWEDPITNRWTMNTAGTTSSNKITYSGSILQK